MQLLDEWRDSVVRKGNSLYKASDGKNYVMSLQNTCMNCHSDKNETCNACHNNIAIKHTCDGCHNSIAVKPTAGIAISRAKGEEVMSMNRREFLKIAGISTIAGIGGIPIDLDRPDYGKACSRLLRPRRIPMPSQERNGNGY